jgi:hypothetical protein
MSERGSKIPGVARINLLHSLCFVNVLCEQYWFLELHTWKSIGPWDHDLSTVCNNACLATLVQPDWDVLEQSRAETTCFLVCAAKHPPRLWGKYLRRSRRYQRPVSIAGKVRRPVRWYPMTVAHTLDSFMLRADSSLCAACTSVLCNFLRKNFMTYIHWVYWLILTCWSFRTIYGTKFRTTLYSKFKAPT